MSVCLAAASLPGQKPAANMVVLDETAVKNLGIETIVAGERDFEETVFAIGRVEEIPGNRYAVSSRIPGRALEIKAFVGDRVREGQTLVRVESRQPGNPPPVIELKAPRNGIVIETDVFRGQPVEPDVELLDISDRTEMWVVARIPEQLAAGVTVGTPARITFPALDGDSVDAELLRFGVEADRDAGAIEGIFVVANEDGRLVPGMRAECEIIVSKRPDVMAVPQESVQGDAAARVVFVRDFDLPNVFVEAPVVLGESGAGWIEIKEGLFPGDEVVTRGAYSLGFAGTGGGMSLKEALDAAHGHEHNEDGSEMTPEQRAAKAAERAGSTRSSEGAAPSWLIAWAIGGTVLMFVFAQLWWRAVRRQRRETGA